MSDVIDGYIDFTNSKGNILRFYAPPEQIIAGMTIGPKPKRPAVEMQLKGGRTQKRFVKEGDPEYESWKDDIEEWKNQSDELREKARLVLSLRDYEYSDPILFPRHIQELLDQQLLPEPVNSIESKALFLRSHDLESQQDENESYFVIQKLSGVPEEVIDKMKEEFRNLLLGSSTDNDRRKNAEDVGQQDSNEIIPTI